MIYHLASVCYTHLLPYWFVTVIYHLIVCVIQWFMTWLVCYSNCWPYWFVKVIHHLNCLLLWLPNLLVSNCDSPHYRFVRLFCLCHCRRIPPLLCQVMLPSGSASGQHWPIRNPARTVQEIWSCLVLDHPSRMVSLNVKSNMYKKDW